MEQWLHSFLIRKMERDISGSGLEKTNGKAEERLQTDQGAY